MTRTMRAIVNTGPGRLELQSLPIPEPGPGQVLIRTSACGICATDLQMIAGWDRTGYPAIPGHEWSGVVAAVGAGVARRRVGTACVAENVLEDGGEVGFEHHGGYGEFFLTRAASLHPIPSSVPLDVAVLIEPLAVCVRGLGRLRLQDRRGALVLGDGPIGLLMLALLHREGVKTLCLLGGRPYRLRLAEDLWDARTLNYHLAGADLSTALLTTFGRRFPVVVEASGSTVAAAVAVDLAEPLGKVLVMGDYAKGRADFSWNHLMQRELEVIGTNASAGGWSDAVSIVSQSVPMLQRLVTHRLPAERFAEGVELARTGRETIKVALLWNGSGAVAG